MSKEKPAFVTIRVFLLDNGKIFLMLRNGKGSSHGGHKRWISPGGVTEGNEEAIDCVIRETEEEIGLKLEQENLTVLLEKYDPQFDANMVYFLCTEWEGKIVLKERKKFDRIQWVPLRDVKSLDNSHGAHLGVYIQDAVDVLLERSSHKKASSAKPIYAKW